MRVAPRIVPRGEPLDPVCAIALGAPAVALARRLLALEDARLATMRGVASTSAARGLLAIMGDDLPWVDGITYLGRDPAAPRLLLPTTLATDLPVALVERALLRAHPGAPLAVLLHEGVVVPLADALPIERAKLERWLAEHA